eukprot:TCONS_00053464-protein
MKGLFCLVLFSLAITKCFATTAEDTKCCEDGVNYGRKLFAGDKQGGQCADNPNNARGFFCQILFKQCCTHAIKDGYCRVGRSLALAKVTCMEPDTQVEEYRTIQKQCCNCCKDGHRAGIFGKSCILPFADEYCKVGFKNCCERAKKDQQSETNTLPPPTRKPTQRPRPTTKVTLPPTKEGTTKAIQKILSTPSNVIGRKCSDVKCDPKTSLGCFYASRFAKCKCKEGHKNHGRFFCKAENACYTSKNRCRPEHFCISVHGVPRCYMNCPTTNRRYTKTKLSNGQQVCEDVDECKENLHRCNAETQECINTVGGYRCKNVRCVQGFRMINGRCKDVDECLDEPSICGKGQCQNYHGSYYCECRDGYSSDPTTKVCTDVNECAISSRKYCDYKCMNTEGSFECSCPKGYRIMGEDCIDIDECKKNPGICPSGSFCFNTHGSYQCIEQKCPDMEYYAQEARKGDPMACKKVCDEAPLEKKMQCELGRTPQSIKRVTYKYEKEIGVEGFIYKYWWSFPRDKYEVKVTLKSGHEHGRFRIIKTGPESIRIENQSKVYGPRRFQLVMHMDVLQRVQGSPLRYRYETIFFIDVSEHNFSWR